MSILDTIVSEMIPIVLHPLIKFPHLPRIKRDRPPSLLPHPRRCTHTHSYPGGIIQSRSHPLKKSTQKEGGNQGRGDLHTHSHMDGGDQTAAMAEDISSSAAVLDSWENFDHFTPKG